MLTHWFPAPLEWQLTTSLRIPNLTVYILIYISLLLLFIQYNIIRIYMVFFIFSLHLEINKYDKFAHSL